MLSNQNIYIFYTVHYNVVIPKSTCSIQNDWFLIKVFKIYLDKILWKFIIGYNMKIITGLQNFNTGLVACFV